VVSEQWLMAGRLMGREELADLAAQEEAATITCEFCRQEYTFVQEDLQRLDV
jgi:redox-regulated HSP33 family molecular chaperone